MPTAEPSPTNGVLVTLTEDVGAPDGMTVDARGGLWVAVYGGGHVQRYSPDGVLSRTPPTACCAALPRRRAAPHDDDPGRADHVPCLRRAEFVACP
jgi:sugar lactone lactonase YvrE